MWPLGEGCVDRHDFVLMIPVIKSEYIVQLSSNSQYCGQIRMKVRWEDHPMNPSLDTTDCRVWGIGGDVGQNSHRCCARLDSEVGSWNSELRRFQTLRVRARNLAQKHGYLHVFCKQKSSQLTVMTDVHFPPQLYTVNWTVNVIDINTLKQILVYTVWLKGLLRLIGMLWADLLIWGHMLNLGLRRLSWLSEFLEFFLVRDQKFRLTGF